MTDIHGFNQILVVRKAFCLIISVSTTAKVSSISTEACKSCEHDKLFVFKWPAFMVLIKFLVVRKAFCLIISVSTTAKVSSFSTEAYMTSDLKLKYRGFYMISNLSRLKLNKIFSCQQGILSDHFCQYHSQSIIIPTKLISLFLTISMYSS